MQLQWLGHACFAITHKGYTIVIDPYNSDYTNGYPKLRLKADMASCSLAGRRATAPLPSAP